MTLISSKLLAAIATALVACLAVIAAYSGKEVATVATGSLEPNVVLGAGSTFITEETTFAGNIVVGGRVISSSTVATATLSPNDIKGVKLFNSKAAAAATLTLPTKALFSGVGFLPNAGDTAEWLIHASTSPVTLAGGTGVRLSAVGTTSLTVNSLHTGTIRFLRLPANEGSTIEAHLLQDATNQ